MTDGQSTLAGHHRRTGPLLTTALLMTLGLFVLGGCSAAASPGGAPGTRAAPAPPPPAATAPGPSAPQSVGGGTVPCLSATNPGQLCGGGSFVPPPPAQTLPSPPFAGATPVASPVVPKGTPVPPPVPTAAPVLPSKQPVASPLVVTSADNGTTLRLTVGQRFLLDLGSSVDWAVTVSDEQVVGRVMGILVPAGAQGVYDARSTGSALLNAIGSPPCPSGSVCPMFRIGFRLTIVVS